MLAGFLIAIAAVVYLRVGAPLGAILFAVGLLAILEYKLPLFTGKAGLLGTEEIGIVELGKIWFMNFAGVFLTIFVLASLPLSVQESLRAKAGEIIEIRNSVGMLENVFLGIGCGFLMYLAVNSRSQVLTILCVAAFILAGFNHCVADMAYMVIGAENLEDWRSLIPTTIGNVIGANMIHLREETA